MKRVDKFSKSAEPPRAKVLEIQHQRRDVASHESPSLTFTQDIRGLPTSEQHMETTIQEVTEEEPTPNPCVNTKSIKIRTLSPRLRVNDFSFQEAKLDVDQLSTEETFKFHETSFEAPRMKVIELSQENVRLQVTNASLEDRVKMFELVLTHPIAVESSTPIVPPGDSELYRQLQSAHLCKRGLIEINRQVAEKGEEVSLQAWDLIHKMLIVTGRISSHTKMESNGLCPNPEEIMEYGTFFLFRKDSAEEGIRQLVGLKTRVDEILSLLEQRITTDQLLSPWKDNQLVPKDAYTQSFSSDKEKTLNLLQDEERLDFATIVDQEEIVSVAHCGLVDECVTITLVLCAPVCMGM
eukprot:Gb_22721 [translate_table: standard]